jgi:hypothetical protein
MEGNRDLNAENRTLQICLKEDDLQILDKYRGELTRDAFLSALLQMVESGAVSKTPDWVQKKES